jgi:bis(5'-nucleosidyl)-tetraphosphatase
MILSAGVVVVRREEGEWNYLFLRAYRTWDFPKGLVEKGEEPLEAAKREVKEETGIDNLNFRWGTFYKETPPYLGKKKIARYYIAETTTREVQFSKNPEIGRPEHHEYRWLPHEEIVRIAPERLRDVVQWAGAVLHESAVDISESRT